MDCAKLVESYKSFKSNQRKQSSTLLPKAIRRFFNTNFEIRELIAENQEMTNITSDWIKRKFDDEPSDEIEIALLNIKLSKNTLDSQNSFLILMTLFVASVSTFLSVIVESQGIAKDILGVSVIGAFVIFALFKRGHFLEYSTYCGELDIYLSKELERRNG